MSYQIFINGVELDLDTEKEDMDVPITYALADAKQPEKRKRSSSKTIGMPGTIKNNAFFMSAWDLNITDVYGDLIGFDFDPTLRYPCRLLRYGKEIFRGSANLTRVKKIRRVNRFEVVLYSEIADLFQALGDRTVAELGWEAYDHVLSIANIEASWSASTGSGYVYPLIDFGLTNDLLSYKTNQLRPYVYCTEIIKKCFAVAGLTMQSTFLNSAKFKKLIWGYGGGEPVLLDSSQVASRRAHYSGDGSTTYNLPYSSYMPLPGFTDFGYNLYIPISDNLTVNMTQISDPTNQFDEPSGELVVANAGTYRLAVSGSFPISYAFTGGPWIDETYFIDVRVRIYKNFAQIGQATHYIVDGNSGSDVAVFNLVQEIECNAGDIITSVIVIDTHSSKITGNAIGETLDITFDLNNTLDYDFTAINTGLIDGDDVQISRFLPEMKAADFLKDMITMFNLYMSDPDNDNAVKFEPMSTFFYETDDVDQWSDKIHSEGEIEIMPAANIEGKTYKFMWAQDEDYYKSVYARQFGHQYGDYDYNVPSTFKKGDKIYQLKIAQSCPVQISGTDIIIPRIIKLDEGSGVASPHKGKPRMFFYNGLKNCDDWSLVNSDTLAVTTENQYPQAHHLDSLTAPTLDLNFGVPTAVFWTATAYTTSNLFSNYHADNIRELTGRDSKVVNALFRLTEDDLYPNFMRRLCNIDGVLYRKNIVKDFQATRHELTKVELIKILKGRSRRNYDTLPPKPLEPALNPTTTITADQPVRRYDKSFVADTSGGDITVTLDATNQQYRDGQEWDFVKLGGNNLIFDVVGGETLNGLTTQTIRTDYDAPNIIYKQGQYYFN